MAHLVAEGSLSLNKRGRWKLLEVLDVARAVCEDPESWLRWDCLLYQPRWDREHPKNYKTKRKQTATRDCHQAMEEYMDDRSVVISMDEAQSTKFSSGASARTSIGKQSRCQLMGRNQRGDSQNPWTKASPLQLILDATIGTSQNLPPIADQNIQTAIEDTLHAKWYGWRELLAGISTEGFRDSALFEKCSNILRGGFEDSTNLDGPDECSSGFSSPPHYIDMVVEDMMQQGDLPVHAVKQAGPPS